jgi:hypothetical protein
MYTRLGCTLKHAPIGHRVVSLGVAVPSDFPNQTLKPLVGSMLEWSVLPDYGTRPRLRYGSGSGCGFQRKMTDGSGSDEEPKKMNGRLQVRWRTQRKRTASDPGLAPEEDERTASDPATDPKRMNGSGSELTDPKI